MIIIIAIIILSVILIITQNIKIVNGGAGGDDWYGGADITHRGDTLEDGEKVNFEPYYHRTIEHLKREKYNAIPYWQRVAPHFGQRKLLCNEVEFLTKYGGTDETVVYAGAASGIHSVLLSEMFPNYTFHLYDPRDFYEKLNDQPNVFLHQEYFTDKVAADWQGKNVMFMSDIRTGTVATHDVEVEINMNQQYKWTELMSPKYAMLKFRLPWKAGKTKYFDGEIYTQPWVGGTSTESRLITKGETTIEYDNVKYEEQMMHFQRCRRNAFHDHDITMAGIDHCNDCWSEIEIIKEYLRRTPDLLGENIPPTNKNICKYIQLFSTKTFSNLNMPPHGVEPNNRDIWNKMCGMKQITYDSIKAKINKRIKHAKENNTTILQDETSI